MCLYPGIALFCADTKNLANCGASIPLIILNACSCSPMLLVHSFSTYLHRLFLEACIQVAIWKTSLLMFNCILQFCSSSLHYLQFSNVRFQVTTSYGNHTCA